jgi:hypothetical protein
VAWGAFRLYLACTDRRSWTWLHHLIEENATPEDKRIFIDNNMFQLPAALAVLRTPGRCFCSSPPPPLPAFEESPAKMEVLHWIVKESDCMVTAVGKLRRPGAPTEFMDSATVEEYEEQKTTLIRCQGRFHIGLQLNIADSSILRSRTTILSCVLWFLRTMTH